MSSKNTKKASSSPKAPEPIITRTKSAQQKRQLRKKEKKTVKPKLTKTEIKSPKPTKTVICTKDKEALLKESVKKTVEVIEQVEYYPDKLKRDISTKKIMLKPKHNFKVIAATNKRKMATPHKELKSPPPKKQSQLKPPRSKFASRPCSSPEISIQDMVRQMEETRSLSDEDFMEILTCPSPVWWEDPPDSSFNEDSLYTRSTVSSPVPIINKTKKRKASNSPTNKQKNKTPHIVHSTVQPKTTIDKKDEKFAKKKLKLESLLGSIKNKTVKKKNEIVNHRNKIVNDKNKIVNDKSEKVNGNVNEKNRKLSESEGDISDLSFNEEEILKNLENMDIPIETSTESVPVECGPEVYEIEIKKEIFAHYEKEIASNNIVRPHNIPIEVKQEILEDIPGKGGVISVNSSPGARSQCDVSLGEMSPNTDKKSNDIVIMGSCTNSSSGNNEDSNCEEFSSNSEVVISPKVEIIDAENLTTSDFFLNKKLKDLSEYITVYKIIPEKSKADKNTNKNDTTPIENNNQTNKLNTVTNKLNNFFKHCKSNKLLKKKEHPVPAKTLTDVKEETINIIEISDINNDLEEKKRLKCDFCVEKTGNGTIEFSCDKCEMAPILSCDLCNFHSNSNEVYSKHVSSCKDVARISWSQNYVLNPT